MEKEKQLLKAIFHLTGRMAFPEEKIIEIITSSRGGKKQIDAYNLCDGIKTQTEIAKEVGIDRGSFSRSVNRWISEGILIRLGNGRNSILLHLYPIYNFNETEND